MLCFDSNPFSRFISIFNDAKYFGRFVFCLVMTTGGEPSTSTTLDLQSYTPTSLSV